MSFIILGWSKDYTISISLSIISKLYSESYYFFIIFMAKNYPVFSHLDLNTLAYDPSPISFIKL